MKGRECGLERKDRGKGNRGAQFVKLPPFGRKRGAFGGKYKRKGGKNHTHLYTRVGTGASPRRDAK